MQDSDIKAVLLKYGVDNALMPRGFSTFYKALNADSTYEFAGDALLDAALVHVLVERYPTASTSELNAWKVDITNNNNLADLASRVGLRSTRNVANVFEAWIFALYKADDCDSGLAWKRVLTFVGNVTSAFFVILTTPRTRQLSSTTSFSPFLEFPGRVSSCRLMGATFLQSSS